MADVSRAASAERAIPAREKLKGGAKEEFIERARAVSIDEVADRLGLQRRGKREEHAGPCPACGGTDCFAFNTRKNAWNCRAAGIGGRDALSIAAHVLGLDLSQRAGFLAACEAVTGETAPDEGRESDGERAARLARLEAQRLANERKAAERAAAGNRFREREIEKARGKWMNAFPLGGTDGAEYLYRRTGCRPRHGGQLRFRPDLYYWTDAGGEWQSVHSGPAMIAPFVDRDGQIIGCHQTWIDLACAPKFRPLIVPPPLSFSPSGLDGSALAADDSAPPLSGKPLAGAPLPTKKMRGVKAGGLIPVAGFVQVNGADGVRIVADGLRPRMVAGEGIETVLAVASAEGFRKDTLYAAAGDIGNLAGRADHASDFYHPNLKKPDRNGKERRVKIAGPEPDFNSAAMPVPDFVSTLVLLADGDSERIWTAAQMARAAKRHAREGRTIAVAWPPARGDFADVATAGNPHE